MFHFLTLIATPRSHVSLGTSSVLTQCTVRCKICSHFFFIDVLIKICKFSNRCNMRINNHQNPLVTQLLDYSITKKTLPSRFKH